MGLPHQNPRKGDGATLSSESRGGGAGSIEGTARAEFTVEERLALQIDNPALDADHRGMSPIVGAQLGKDVLDATLYGVFGDRQLIGDLLVGIATGNQAEHLDFG